MSASRVVQVVEKFVVPGGSSAAEALATTSLPTAGPDAIVVVRTVDGVLKDLAWAPEVDTEVEPVAMSDPDGLDVLRHSTAHVLAQAVQDIFADTRLGVGPPVENGFYYDFDVTTPFTPEDLERIEVRMREIVKAGQHFSRRVTDPESAKAELAHEPFKLELIDLKKAEPGVPDIGDSELTMYDNLDRKTGECVWTDLCRGPHLPSTRLIPAFKLMRSSAAYWRGSEKNPTLQRIYGTAWPTRDEQKTYVKNLAEALKRDHRKLGEELELFTFSKEIGKGLPLWLPNGTIIRDELEGWARKTERRLGYQRVSTPHITQQDLYFLSGHLPYYTEDLYAPIDIEGEQYYLRPMNCPHHHMVYRDRPRSYRELPFKIAEYGMVYRFEKSGQLHGLMRTRGFTQNDAHIYCRFEDAKAQFLEVMRMHDEYYRALGIEDFYMVLALRDPADTEKYHDDQEMWETAERITREAMDESGIPYVVESGGAAHYGPKVDFMIKSVTGKEFAASTNQVDLYTPKQFGLNFHDSDGTEKPVVTIHRAPLGSHERFVAFLIEHFGGSFPVWLSPEQVRIITVAEEDKLTEYARRVRETLLDADVRVEMDHTDNRLPHKVRAAATRKVPLIVVLGAREADGESVSVRYRGGSEASLSLTEFVTHVRDLIDTKSLQYAGHIRADEQ